jgi:hypothetical protein
MRTKLMTSTLIALVLWMEAVMAATPSIAQSLSPEELRALPWPEYSTQELQIAGVRVLLVSQDVGSGLSLRDCFVYQWRDAQWVPVVFVSTTSSEVVAKQIGGKVVLISKAGKVLLEIPIETLNAKFDSKEHAR